MLSDRDLRIRLAGANVVRTAVDSLYAVCQTHRGDEQHDNHNRNGNPCGAQQREQDAYDDKAAAQRTFAELLVQPAQRCDAEFAEQPPDNPAVEPLPRFQTAHLRQKDHKADGGKCNGCRAHTGAGGSERERNGDVAKVVQKQRDDTGKGGAGTNAEKYLRFCPNAVEAEQITGIIIRSAACAKAQHKQAQRDDHGRNSIDYHEIGKQTMNLRPRETEIVVCIGCHGADCRAVSVAVQHVIGCVQRLQFLREIRVLGIERCTGRRGLQRHGVLGRVQQL